MSPSPLVQDLILAGVKIAVVVGSLLGLFSLMTWIERRTLAFMQYRLGPNRTGPLGILQPIADGIKLFFKEEVMPAAADKWAFLAAPVVAVATALLAVAVVPYGPPFTLPAWGLLPEWLRGRTLQIQIATIDVGLLFIFAVTALGVYGIVLAGWAANNKYSLIGGLRSSAQMFSYELALGLSWVGIIMLAGSFQITDIVDDQGARAGGWFLGWNAFVQFPAFLVYFFAATAEVARIPFDLPEGEAELVAGFHTEYSSMRFALIQMAEYINMITVAVLGTNLFLGGWHAGIPGLPSEGLFGFVWWGAKVAVFLFVFIWLRGTLPRVRYDQLMHFGWKVLRPGGGGVDPGHRHGRRSLPWPLPGREPLMDAILFYVFAAIAVASAVVVIGQRSPMYSAFALIVTLCSLTVIFALLGSPFIAVLQVIVYAGAIMVLFLFVLMLLNVKSEEDTPQRGGRTLRGVALALVTLLVLQAGAVLLRTGPEPAPQFDASTPDDGAHPLLGRTSSTPSRPPPSSSSPRWWGRWCWPRRSSRAMDHPAFVQHALLLSLVLFGIGYPRRLPAAQRHHRPHVHRADAQRRQPRLRGLQPRGGHARRAGARLLRDDGRGGRGGGRPGHRHRPPPARRTRSTWTRST